MLFRRLGPIRRVCLHQQYHPQVIGHRGSLGFGLEQKPEHFLQTQIADFQQKPNLYWLEPDEFTVC